MKILNAMFGTGLGGIEQALLDYNDALVLAGHEVHAIVHPAAQIRAALTDEKITVHTLHNLGAWDPFAVTRMKKLLKTLNPDICIAHGNRAISLLRHAHAPKLIGVTHNYKTKCKGLAAVFCPTQDLQAYAEAQGAPKDRTVIIPNMVRVPDFLPSRKRHAPVVIGSMGRFVAKKGFEIFIEALAVLKVRGVKFQAILAGGGEELPALEAKVADKGLTGTLQFVGWTEDKEAFFNAIDMFCLPSLHEPFGIVLLEAMAQGLPVVATHSEGPSQIIQTNVNGILVPVGDATALADGLQLVIAGQAAAQKFSENAYRTVRERYDIKVISAKLDLALRAVRPL